MTHALARLCTVCGVVGPAETRFCPACGSRIPIEPTAAELQRMALGVALGPQFELHERIGRGGFGMVYRATDHVLERQVAVKVLHTDRVKNELTRRRFLCGAQLLAFLEHPHIMPIYDVRETGRVSFLVMPFLEGESLAAVLLREGRIARREAVRILVEVAEALEEVHAAGLVHRDIKPQHILLHGRERRVRLIDFSLAWCAADGPRTAAARGTTVVGTPAYMSPEQAEAGHTVDGRSDLYSLGVVGYQLLTGALLFEGTAAEQIAAHRTQLPPNPALRQPDIPMDLGKVVVRCLAKLPEERWGSARALAAALMRQSDALPLPPAPPGATTTHSAPAAGEVISGGAAVFARPDKAARAIWFRNAPLWMAAAIVVLLLGYCARR